MDFKAKTRSWLQKVSRKFEDLCEGVGSSICAPVTVDVLENQFQTVQTTFRNFCSELVEELFPLISSLPNSYYGALDSSVQQASETTDLTGQEGSNNGIEGDNEGGDCDGNLPSKAATVELLADTPLQQSDDTNLSSRATTDHELLVNKPLQQSDDLATEERPNILSQKLLKKLNPEAETDFVEEKNLSPETLKLVCPAPSDSLAEVSDDFTFSENHDEFVESEDLLSVANSGRSDDTSAGVAEDDHVSKKGMETIQPNDKELDEICFTADDKILLSNSVLEVKIAPHQEYEVESFEDVNAEADYQLIEEENATLTPLLVAQEMKSPDQVSCDSDWEII